MKVNVKKLLCLLVALFPILPVNYYIGSVNFPTIAAVLVSCFYFVWKKTFLIHRNKYTIYWFWMYIFIYVLQALFTSSVFTALAYFISYGIVAYIIIQLTKEKSCRDTIITNLIIFSSILAILGIVQSLSGTYIFQSELLNAEEGMRYGILRCTTTFAHPIGFGLFQAVIALLTFYKIQNSDGSKRVLIIQYILVVISCFCSVSRLGICLYLAGQVLLILKLGVNRAIKYLCIVIIAIVLLLIAVEILGFGFITSLVSDFTSALSSMFFGKTVQENNAIGFGNRLDLYDWVINMVGSNWLFGFGIDAKFEYKMYEWFTKTSIEVHYLNVFYHSGIVGLIPLVLSYIETCCFFGKYRKFALIHEKRLSYLDCLFIIFVLYCVCLFGVQETDTLRIMTVLIAMGIAYVNSNADEGGIFV